MDLLIKRVFVTIWIPGIMYSICIHHSSNQGFFSISSASTVALIGTLFMLGRAVTIWKQEWLENQELLYKAKNTLMILSALFLILLQIRGIAYARYYTVYWDYPIKTLNCCIKQGPEKGIYTTEEKREFYDDFIEDLHEIKQHTDAKNVLYLSSLCWAYLVYPEDRVTTFSAWLHGHTIERLQAYYLINPDKEPDVILVDDDYQGDRDALFADKNYVSYISEHGREVLYR